MFDGDGDGTPELYVGTLNSQTDFDGAIALQVYIGGKSSVGIPNFFNDELLRDPEALQEFLEQDLANLIHSDGGEIWRYDFVDQEWTQVFSVDMSNGELDDGDIGFRDMVTFNDHIYASTSTSLIYNVANGGDNEAKIFRSSDGTDWSLMEGGPLDVEGTRSIRALTSVDINGVPGLLVGTENLTDGAQVWLYTEEGGVPEWTLLTTFDGTTADYVSVISEIDIFTDPDTGEETIFFGGWFPYKLYAVTPDDIEDVYDGTTSGLIPIDATPIPENFDNSQDPINDDGVMQIIQYGDWFYVGSVNYGFDEQQGQQRGASLYRTQTPLDRDSWEEVTDTGFEDEGLHPRNGATYTWQMDVVDGVLYVSEFYQSFGGGGGTRLVAIEHIGDGETYDIGFVGENGIVDSEADNPLVGGAPWAYGFRKTVPIEVYYDTQLGAYVPVPESGVIPEGATIVQGLILGTADPFQQQTSDFAETFIRPLGEILLGSPFSRDVLTGTDLVDVMLGGTRGDMFNAGAEDDLIFGDFWGLTVIGGPDTIHGGEGEDIILGNSGNDKIYGDEDEDFLIGGAGRDRVHGGEGADLVMGDFPTDGPVGDFILPLIEAMAAQAENPEEDLGEDAPTIEEIVSELTGAFISIGDALGQFNDFLFGDEGNDVVIGGLGLDRVWGGEGNDVLFGLEGNDRMFGEDGDDVIFGGEGDDRMFGGAGDDVIVTGEGDDMMFGSFGADRFLVRGVIEEDAFIDTGEDIIYGFEHGTDIIDLSAFISLRTTGRNPPPAFDFTTHLLPALSEGENGWLLIDVSLIDGNVDGLLGDVDGDGTILVRGLRYDDVDLTQLDLSVFKVDSDLDDGFNLSFFG
ncbi:calcium-binding protein [Acuticoccus kandeliae]|uniref:calcium-binding protein n=1 Tax=Acuticoccus kandeliae TaxID=2073160 RepID=UPI0014755804|nr:calcium-binding protein [Acuticoccus kandeliae]